MKFYNREKEIALLKNIQQISKKNAQMTVVTGRRRIGKTQLLLETYKEETALYFFVSRKSESLLCKDFQEEIMNVLKIPILGEIESFAKLFRFLMEHSKKQSFTLIIDEFQDFYKINPAIFSDIQKIWDTNKNESNINFIACGSIFSLMHKIFKNAKEPLFGRATHYLKVMPFSTKTLKDILFDYNAHYTSEDLLAFYTFTGGVAKYIQLLVNNKATHFDKIVDYIFEENSIFLTEGQHLLISGYSVSIYASNYGIIVPVITFQTVPIITVQFVPLVLSLWS